MSYILAKLCTYKGLLPQGSPASPYISNIRCIMFDKRLSSLAQKYNANYSRYADDITVSGSKNIINLLCTINTILNEEGFQLNDKKTRFAYNYQKQEVTGLIVNGSEVKISKRYIREVLKNIYYIKKYGLFEHLQRSRNVSSFYKEHLYGQAYFIYMIEKGKGKNILEKLDNINWDY